jgi:hypothetical protein
MDGGWATIACYVEETTTPLDLHRALRIYQERPLLHGSTTGGSSGKHLGHSMGEEDENGETQREQMMIKVRGASR